MLLFFKQSLHFYIADIDYSRIQLYVGNYDFWYEYSQMQIQQAKDQNKMAQIGRIYCQDSIVMLQKSQTKAALQGRNYY